MRQDEPSRTLEPLVSVKKRLEDSILPKLNYIGFIGALVLAVAYIAVIVVLIVGFKVQKNMNNLIFAVVNAIMGVLIMQMLKLQGVTFAKNLPENKVISNAFYSKNKDKKARSLGHYWVTSALKDVVFKGVTVAGTSVATISLVIQGSKDPSLLLFAVVNLLLFICFGFLRLNSAYEYYNERVIPYMKEHLKENENDNNTQQRVS